MSQLLSSSTCSKPCEGACSGGTDGAVAGNLSKADALSRSLVTEIVLPFPPSMNGYWRSVNGRQIISAKGREYRAAVMGLAVRQKWPAFGTSRIRLEIEAWMPDARRRDLDNIIKAPLDALTHAGLWADDSQIDDLRISRAPMKGGMLKLLVEAA